MPLTVGIHFSVDRCRGREKWLVFLFKLSCSSLRVNGGLKCGTFGCPVRRGRLLNLLFGEALHDGERLIADVMLHPFGINSCRTVIYAERP